MDGNLAMGDERHYGNKHDFEHDTGKYALHVHNDIEDAAQWYKIPYYMWREDDVYIMQEDRCVFVGKPKIAEQWMKRNYGKYCKSRWPLT